MIETCVQVRSSLIEVAARWPFTGLRRDDGRIRDRASRPIRERLSAAIVLALGVGGRALKP
jgi:hypothetical protein